MAHDLGHPPFGHIAEKELDSLVRNPPDGNGADADGFEGNAQSFRIVTRLALRSPHHDGLNLTRATLNGMLKYPWLRENHPQKKAKWGAYRSEESEFRWARELMPVTSEEKSLEAQIMDWSDDVTYAVHDVTDFFQANLVPLHRISNSEVARKRFYEAIFSRADWTGPFEREDLIKTFEKFVSTVPFAESYEGTKDHRRALRSFTAGLIAECVKGVHIAPKEQKLVVPPARHKEILMLKQLTWHYVILSPSMATKQTGQKKIIRELFAIFHGAAFDSNSRGIFPHAYRELIEEASSAREVTRLVTDMIAGMTEQQAVNIHRKLTGVALGSLLDPLVR